MSVLTIGLYVWVGLMVGKLLGLPLAKEMSWGQLFLIPVFVFLVRLGVIFFVLVAMALAILSLYWFTGWAPGALNIN